MATLNAMSEETLGRLPRRQLRALKKDPERSAQVIDLRYVNDRMPGILRIRKGKGFSYYHKDTLVKDENILARIRSLAIPPAWNEVWICPYANGHLQVTGKDARGRKQYRYHTKWNNVRSHTKFHHTLEFGERLPMIRKQLARDLAREGLSKEKVLATVVSILDHTHIRVGSPSYEKENRSYGLSTLKDRHVKEGSGTVRLVFKGKTGIAHDIRIRSKKLAKLVRHCRDLPGQELFQYVGEDGEPRPIDSGMVNDYIREISEGPFTSKDFRTWKGTVMCMKALIAETCPSQASERKEIINRALDEAARHLGNTRAVCRKYYIHPEVITAYECEQLHRSVSRAKKAMRVDRGYTFEERLVLKVLKAARRTTGTDRPITR